MHKIVIVGGGAGGLELATKLGDSLGKKKKAEITLIDAKKTHIWKPLLHEIAAGSINPHKDELDYISEMVVKNMKNAIQLDVPVEIDCGFGPSWFEAH